MQNQRGRLIVIEGIDGSGKSTLAKKLHTYFGQQEIDTILTKEPGGSPLGTALRTILQERHVAACPKAEYLLFAADRAQHMHEIIMPALTKGTHVLSDRMGDSSIVYQGYARGLSIDMITQINQWAMQDMQPDVTIFVDVPVTVAQQRWAARNEALSAFEKEHETFMQRVRDGFHALYKTRKNVIMIDGTASADTVFQQTITALTQWLQHEKSSFSSSTLAR